MGAVKGCWRTDCFDLYLVGGFGVGIFKVGVVRVVVVASHLGSE